MAWEDVALTDVEKDELIAQGFYTHQPSATSWTGAATHDIEEETFDEEGDRREFEMAQSKETRSGIAPTRFPLDVNNLVARAKSVVEETDLFPTYEETPRRDGRAERVAIINNTSILGQLDDTMPQETVDDTCLQHPPTRHVDYLTHDWIEEDICASWRKVVAARRDSDDLQSRLENASWRTWAKTRLQLDTLSPESINWTKDEDVTWLYGPFYSPRPWRYHGHTTASNLEDSTVSLRSSLKTPALEEILLHRSVSELSLCLPSLLSTSTSQTLSQSIDLNATLDTSHTENHAPKQTKSVSFHVEVAQCIAVVHDSSSETPSSWPGSNLYNLFSPLSPSAQSGLEDTILSKTIELIAPTKLKPEASPTPSIPSVSTKSWPSRTLSYFFEESKETPSVPSVYVRHPYTPPPKEGRSYFDEDDEEDDEDDEIHWNPPRPRKLPTDIAKSGSLPQDCQVVSKSIASSQDQSCELDDEELFEAEMFGSSLENRRNIISSDDETESKSARSSPSISEYLSSSSEDLEDSEFDGPVCKSDANKQQTYISWSKNDFKSSENSNSYLGKADPLSLGLGYLGATATAGFTNLLTRFEQASSSVVSTVTKERAFAASCSSEYNSIYRTANRFATQRPVASEFTSTDDEEHWWMNV